jgi:hypothetical protein
MPAKTRIIRDPLLTKMLGFRDVLAIASFPVMTT